jgi:hypothetical protein
MKQGMKVIKFAAEVLLMLVIVHPSKWKWEYSDLKEKYFPEND